MGQEDEAVREVKVRTIPLQRPRRRRAGTESRASSSSRLLRGMETGVRGALAPFRDTSLAMLGLTALLARGTGRAWRALVTEGASVQADLTAGLQRALRRLPLPGRGQEAGQNTAEA
jgi:hypothetical protein